MTIDDFMVMNEALLPLKKKLLSQLLKFTLTHFIVMMRPRQQQKGLPGPCE